MNQPIAEDALQTLFWSANTKLAPTPCPSPQELVDAVHQELSPAQMQRIVDHCALCPSCAELWRMSRALLEDMERSSSCGLKATRAFSLQRHSLENAMWSAPPSANSRSNAQDGDPSQKVRRLRLPGKTKQRSLICALSFAAAVGVIWRSSVGPEKDQAQMASAMRGSEHGLEALEFSAKERAFSWMASDEITGPCEVSVSTMRLEPISTLAGNRQKVKIPEHTWRAMRGLQAFYWQLRCRDVNQDWRTSKTMKASMEEDE